jgi:hypothetical protein
MSKVVAAGFKVSNQKLCVRGRIFHEQDPKRPAGLAPRQTFLNVYRFHICAI